jgi:hypothetical protein
MTKKLANPLDDLFQTEQPTGEMAEYKQLTEGELAELQPAAEKDAEDAEIDQKIDTVYTSAIETFQQQMQYAEIVEPRYAARNAEVAANYLNIALNAAGMRAKVKSDRKRSSTFAPFAAKSANGTVVASLDDIMKVIAVDAETKVDK